jgi:hypothetical protein
MPFLALFSMCLCVSLYVYYLSFLTVVKIFKKKMLYFYFLDLNLSTIIENMMVYTI